MHTHDRNLCRYAAALAVLFCCGLAAPLRLAAQGTPAQGASAPQAISVETLTLAPQGAPGFAEVTAVAAQAELTCADAICSLRVRQTYVLHNRDQVQSAALRVTLAGSEGQPASPYALSIGDGQPVPPGEGVRPQWELTLSPNQQRTLWLDTQHELGAAPFVRWRWDMAALRPWGTLVSARAALRLPAYVTDDALLGVSPPPAGFDGYELLWEWEGLAAPEPVEVALYAPPAWARLRALEMGADGYALARYRLELYAAAQAAKLPLPDPFPVAVADLLAAISADPAHDQARLALADLYLARAEAAAEMRLNYVTLAARQLEAVQVRHPDDVTLAQRLSALYYDAAQTASRAGDPAGALEYLRKGVGPSDGQAAQDLTLRWAADLAQAGQVARAIQAMQGVIAPALLDAFLHYAPPIVQARTDVLQRPDGRQVRYTFALYEPSAAKARQRLVTLVDALAGVPGCQVELLAPEDATQVELLLRTTVTTPRDWTFTQAGILAALGPDPDLLAALLAAPWQGELTAHVTHQQPLATDWAFGEQVSLAALLIAYDREAQYAHWRLVELRSAPAAADQSAAAKPIAGSSAEQAELQHRLGLALLQDQARLWDQLPSASLWTYTVEPPAIAGLEPGQWLLHWGEVRTLTLSQRAIAWGRVRWLGAGLGCLLLSALLIAMLPRRHR